MLIWYIGLEYLGIVYCIIFIRGGVNCKRLRGSGREEVVEKVVVYNKLDFFCFVDIL